ncbi:hypothetical protein pb186bvf_007215 [Paramecium bursaria]
MIQGLEVFRSSSLQEVTKRLLSVNKNILTIQNPNKQILKNIPLERMRVSWTYNDAGIVTRMSIHYNNKVTSYYGQKLNELKFLLDGKVSYKNFLGRYSVLKLLKKTETYKILLCENKQGERKIAKFFLTQSKQIDDEIQIFQKVKGLRYLVQIEEYYRDETYTIIIIEYCSGGTLYENTQIDDKKKIMKRILKGLANLHSLGIAHRDIKMDNIMLKEKDDPKSVVIIDFGLSVIIQQKPYCVERCGTPGYIAPEMFTEDDHNELCDIFSLGAVFHIFLTGNRIYQHQILSSNQANLIRINQSLPLLEKSLIQCMLAKKVSKRFTAKQCLSHEYFNKEERNSINTLMTPQLNELLKNTQHSFIYHIIYQHSLLEVKFIYLYFIHQIYSIKNQVNKIKELLVNRLYESSELILQNSTIPNNRDQLGVIQSLRDQL